MPKAKRPQLLQQPVMLHRQPRKLYSQYILNLVKRGRWMNIWIKTQSVKISELCINAHQEKFATDRH